MNHEFSNSALLEEALTHTSHAYEFGGKHNERLEFLGDAILQIVATELLFHRFPDDREGVLHGYRSRLVSTEHLAKLARHWRLDEKVRLGKGEDSTGGREKDRLLAGVFEAVLGAVYLDAGFDAARTLISGTLAGDLDALPTVSDARKALHEWSQRNFNQPPAYSVVEENGPPHDRTFLVEVACGGNPMGQGAGKSKRTASIAAAKVAVCHLESA